MTSRISPYMEPNQIIHQMCTLIEILLSKMLRILHWQIITLKIIKHLKLLVYKNQGSEEELKIRSKYWK